MTTKVYFSIKLIGLTFIPPFQQSDLIATHNIEKVTVTMPLGVKQNDVTVFNYHLSLPLCVISESASDRMM